MLSFPFLCTPISLPALFSYKKSCDNLRRTLLLPSVVWLIENHALQRICSMDNHCSKKENLESKIYACQGCCIPFPVENQPETRQTWAEMTAKLKKKEKKHISPSCPLCTRMPFSFEACSATSIGEQKRGMETAKEVEVWTFYNILSGMLFVCLFEG